MSYDQKEAIIPLRGGRFFGLNEEFLAGMSVQRSLFLRELPK